MTKKRIVQLSVLGAVVLLLLALVLTDYGISRQYTFDVLLSEERRVTVADGKSALRVKVRLSKGGRPVEGHTVYLFASNGSLPTARCVTDEEGCISFYYYPYLYVNDKVTPLEDVVVTMQDESNSKVFMISARSTFTIKILKSDEAQDIDDWQNITTGTENEEE